MHCCEPPQITDKFIQKIKPCQMHGLPIIQICRQNICLSRALMCQKCQKLHQNHTKQPLKAFLVQQYGDYTYRINEKLHQTNYYDAKKLITQSIEQLHSKIVKKIDLIKQKCQQKFQQLKKEIDNQHYERYRELSQIMLDRQMTQQLLIKLNKSKNNAWIYSLQQDIVPFIEVLSRKMLTYLTQLENFVENAKWENQRQRKSHIQAILTQRFPELDQQLWPVRFSSFLKNQKISVQFNGLEALYQGSHNKQSVAVLLNKKITKEKQTRISFQINTLCKTHLLSLKGPQVIGIGVCGLQGAMRHKYCGLQRQFSGAYLLFCDGYAFSSRRHISKSNPYEKSFRFEQDDIIDIQIHFTSNQLSLRTKKQYEERFKISLPNLIHYQFYPFICFKGSERAKVSIISVKTLHTEQNRQNKLSLTAKKYEKPNSIKLM